MSDTPIPPTDDDLVGTADDPIQPIQLQDEMENSFLEYAMSVIMSRASPTCATASSRSTAGSSGTWSSRGSAPIARS